VVVSLVLRVDYSFLAASATKLAEFAAAAVRDMAAVLGVAEARVSVSVAATEFYLFARLPDALLGAGTKLRFAVAEAASGPSLADVQAITGNSTRYSAAVAAAGNSTAIITAANLVPSSVTSVALFTCSLTGQQVFDASSCPVAAPTSAGASASAGNTMLIGLIAGAAGATALVALYCCFCRKSSSCRVVSARLDKQQLTSATSSEDHDMVRPLDQQNPCYGFDLEDTRVSEPVVFYPMMATPRL
jgi:hypothetical protein